jgi:predicted ATPase
VRELSALHALLTQVVGGQGQVVGIVGEPGIGKSRLLAEWRRSLVVREVAYLTGHCWSYGQATRYLPVLDLLWMNGRSSEPVHPPLGGMSLRVSPPKTTMSEG